MFNAYPQTPRLLEAKAELQGMMEDAYTGLIAEGRSENEAVGQVIRDFGNLDELAPVLGIASDIGPAAGAAAVTAAVTAAGTAAGTELAVGRVAQAGGQQGIGLVAAGAAGAALGATARPDGERWASASPATPSAGAGATPPPAAEPRHPPVTMEEAQGYADAQRRIRFSVSVAVMLFVLSPATLIFLPTAAAERVVPLTEAVGAFIGIAALLALVTAGVVLLVTTSRQTEPHERLEQGRFSPDPEVSQWAADLAQRHRAKRVRALQIALALWILSPAPLIAFALLTEGSPHADVWAVGGVALVLALVAAGLGVLLPQAWTQTVADKLTKGGGAGAGGCVGTDGRGGQHGIVGVIAAFYWPLLTIIFLTWSFIGDAWGISWIVWPVGAVLFGAITGGASALEGYRRERANT
jgi:hypothetical protein